MAQRARTSMRKVRRPAAVCLLAGLLLAGGCRGSLHIGGDGDGTTNGETTTPRMNNDPGDPEVTPRTSLHRLNRLEYNNTVRDLLGTSLRPADDFPPDASVGGLDNVSTALSITPALMDRYFEGARAVVEDAFAARPAFADRFEEDDARLTYTIDRDANRIGGIVRLRGGGASGAVEVPAEGAHTLVVWAQGLVNGVAPEPRLRVSVAGQDFDFDVPRTMQDTSFALTLAPGSHALAIQALNFEENAAENRGNDILFDVVVLASDQLVEGPGRARILVCDLAEPNEATCASTILQTFAGRAWRRPLTLSETMTLDALFATLRAAGEGPEEALKLVLRGILTSSKFIYRYRTSGDANSATLLDPFVIASRLSYFIWSSTPDDRLLAAAVDGTLGTPDGIRQTVTWMLADERASALADGFAEQWLDLRHLQQAAPSAEVYPGFSEAVRTSMVAESKLFFLDYITNASPLASMLQPNFAYRDATLTAHLGLTSPDVSDFERVPVTAADRRGVLALSAWLTARSDTEHSSPIRRGSWIADNVLCAPVPPPPAGLDIGELMEAESGLSLRERLELHRSDRTCAACHANLDVVGMGFEVYDGVGRPIDDPALDSMGELPGGVQFRGAAEMAGAIDPATVVTCVSKKLFSYALGRPVDQFDLDGVPEFEETAVVTLTLPDLVAAIALSPAFSQPSPLK